ncbi:MAG: S-methyl-5'-thioadenosine phosphorylase [Gemmatimonadales bacterium]|nr:MAG: S-methyl-5'-thioadenosine phosphorylase [Gemmatimonadales bacterium]
MTDARDHATASDPLPHSPAAGRVAIIGGTGFHLDAGVGTLEVVGDEVISTRWGSARITRATLPGQDLIFLDRHRAQTEPGAPRIPPHRVNYRANIAALKKVGVTAILASTAVGSLRADWGLGTLVLLDQLLDQVEGRPRTFFDDRAVHVDFTRPYCDHLRRQVADMARSMEIPFQDGGTYICTNGPRFESAAEIRSYRGWGAHVVGMTAVPEVALAREAQISYAGISVVTNPAAGTGEGDLTEQEVMEAMAAAMPRIARLFLEVAAGYRDDPDTLARRATREFGSPDVT